MTQTEIPAWRLNFQLKLMAALDAVWDMLDATTDPAVIRQVRERAKAIGDIAAMARKVALIGPAERTKPPRDRFSDTLAAGLAATGGMAELSALMADAQPAVAVQAEHTRRALDKLKGGRRGRL
jgi:hypothetical protein